MLTIVFKLSPAVWGGELGEHSCPAVLTVGWYKVGYDVAFSCVSDWFHDHLSHFVF